MQKEAALFRALGDPTRLKIAVMLAARGEICVCEIAAALAEPDFKVSRHLTVLRSAGLVEARRQGTWMHYRLTPPDGPLGESLARLLRGAFEDHPLARAVECDPDSSCCG